MVWLDYGDRNGFCGLNPDAVQFSRIGICCHSRRYFRCLPVRSHTFCKLCSIFHMAYIAIQYGFERSRSILSFVLILSRSFVPRFSLTIKGNVVHITLDITGSVLLSFGAQVENEPYSSSGNWLLDLLCSCNLRVVRCDAVYVNP
jgi:hypothetical protein